SGSFQNACDDRNSSGVKPFAAQYGDAGAEYGSMILSKRSVKPGASGPWAEKIGRARKKSRLRVQSRRSIPGARSVQFSASARPKTLRQLKRYVIERPNAGCSPVAAKKCW